MLIAGRKELLLLLAVLQSEIDFFLESTNADFTETDERACSEFFRAISNFLERAAGKDFQQFKDTVWMILIDQLQISNLVSDLRVDVQLFTAALQLTPTKIDDLARSEFLECIFEFLERSIRIIGEPQDNCPPRPAQTKTSALAANLPCQYLNYSANYTNTVCNCIVCNRVDCKARSPNAFAGSSDPSFQSDSLRRWKRKPKLPVHRGQRRTILFSNPSPSTTFIDISELTCGGPLEVIERHDRNKFGVGWNFSHNFLLRFIEPEAAGTFLAFLKSPQGKSYFPVEKNGKISVDWSPWEMTEPYSGTCTDSLNNPARRVLIFQGYPVGVMSEGELIETFRTLHRGSSFRMHTILKFDIFPETREAHLLFSTISAAVGIMELYSLGLLGDEFNGCRVLFGKDPSDRPVPGNEINEDMSLDPGNIAS